MRIQFNLPSEYSQRLEKCPFFPNWRGRESFYTQVFIDYMNSQEFKVKELEYENRRLERERDRLKHDRDEKTKNVQFWMERAGGFLSLFRDKCAAEAARSAQGQGNAA